MSSKFSTPFLKKSPLLGAYTSGGGGMVYASNREAFQKLQNDITKGFDNYVESEGTQQRLQIKSQENIDKMEKDSLEQKRAQQAHNTRFTTKGGVKCPQGETLEPITVNGQTVYKCM